MPVNVIALTNPINGERLKTSIPSGTPLFDCIKLPGNASVSRNGYKYKGEVLEDDDLINIVIAPQGGETGKDIARAGIIIAAQITAAALTANMSTFAQLAITSIAMTGASIGANALVPPEVIE